MEACWAHNPEVRRSKLRSAKSPFFLSIYGFAMLDIGYLFLCQASNHVPLAQRIARWTSNPKVLGSIPRWDDLPFLFIFQLIVYLESIYFLTQIIVNCQDGRVV